MARVFGIDYGLKKTGLAATDSLQIIASGIETIDSKDVIEYVKKYMQEQEVETIVIGEPKHKDGNPTFLTPKVHELAQKLQQLYPNVKVVLQDEMYSSLQAKHIIQNYGYKKQEQKNRKLVDKIAAALIIEEYMKTSGKWDWI